LILAIATWPWDTGTASRSPRQAVALAFLIFTGWCQEHWGTYDVMNANRRADRRRSAIAQWATNYHTRAARRGRRARTMGSAESALDGLVVHGVVSDTLHLAARFGREDLAAILLSAGADPTRATSTTTGRCIWPRSKVIRRRAPAAAARRGPRRQRIGWIERRCTPPLEGLPLTRRPTAGSRWRLC
jgi:hypothetical protein